MVFTATSAFRSVFNTPGFIKHAQHHTHSAVADPNNVIAAKNPFLARLFSCPSVNVKQAKDTATTAQQQQQTNQLSSPTAASSCEALVVPFHTHAGNTARAAVRRSFAYQQAQHNSDTSQRSLIGKTRHCNSWKCPALFISLGRHKPACREGEQHAEEEEADEAYQARGFSFRWRLDRMCVPSIVIQCKAGQGQQQQADEFNQLVLTSSSPVYQHIMESLASLSPSVLSNLRSLLPPTSASSSSSLLTASASSSIERDLPDDEKNNDHIPLPSLPHTLHTITEDGDCYTGQLCSLTSQQHGRGVMQYANGDSYAGDWENGQQHGQGVMCYSGGRYTGQFVRGERCGQGSWEGDEGDRYEGEWRAGLREGMGREWQGDELIYDGEWAANARHGYGVAQSAAGGWRYEGEWVQGVMDGYGSIEYTSGEVWEGQWHAGAMHGEGMRISSAGSSQFEQRDNGSLITAQPQPSSRLSSEGMGAIDALGESVTTGGSTDVEGAPSTRQELLSLLSQVASLQSALVDKLSRVEELLVQPTAGKQTTALLGAASMAA